jgi:hypothetical protein
MVPLTKAQTDAIAKATTPQAKLDIMAQATASWLTVNGFTPPQGTDLIDTARVLVEAKFVTVTSGKTLLEPPQATEGMTGTYHTFGGSTRGIAKWWFLLHNPKNDTPIPNGTIPGLPCGSYIGPNGQVIPLPCPEPTGIGFLHTNVDMGNLGTDMNSFVSTKPVIKPTGPQV